MRRTIIALAIFLSACATTAPRIGVQGTSDRLYCGRDIPGTNLTVSDEEIDVFVREVVLPRFPEGFTMWDAKGTWEGDEEHTLVLEFLHPYGRDYDREIREIADEYRRRFRQKSVMRVTTPALMEFVDE